MWKQKWKSTHRFINTCWPEFPTSKTIYMLTKNMNYFFTTAILLSNETTFKKQKSWKRECMGSNIKRNKRKESWMQGMSN